MSTKLEYTDHRQSLRRNVVFAVLVIALLFGGLGTWSAVASIAGAVITSGKVVVESKSKKVQHDEGGIVSAINVKDGDYVEGGDLLLRLDDTINRATLAVVQKQIEELQIRRTRLRLERDGRETVTFPEKPTRPSYTQAEYNDLKKNQQFLFEARRDENTSRQLRLEEQIGQINEELKGLEVQLAANQHETVLIKEELDGLFTLEKKGLVQKNRLIALQRDAARISGRIGEIRAQIAQSKRRASEIEIEMARINEEFRTEILTGLSDIRTQLNELLEKEITALDRLKRVDIRAPRNGYVHELGVHTIGGVIRPGETVMQIVPKGDSLTVETRVAPQDIDQLFVGQDVTLRFIGLNQRTTPEVKATLSKIGVDLSTDEDTGAQYFKAYIDLGSDQFEKLVDEEIVPGMPVEAFIQTNHRRVISYLMKPLTDHLNKVFRES